MVTLSVLFLWVVACNAQHYPQPNFKVTQSGTEFMGRLSVTKEGKECQRWDEQRIDKVTPANFPDASIQEAGNYCRNPDSDPAGPWCFTTDKDVFWQYCDIQKIDLCPLGDEYGRSATEAIRSATLKSFHQCATAVYLNVSEWISWDSSSGSCKLYGNPGITLGVVKGNTGTTKHYSTSACQLEGTGVTAEYQQCLSFFDGTSIQNNPYSGFTCRKGPFGYTESNDLTSTSGANLRKTAGPLTRVVVYTLKDRRGLSLRMRYGADEEIYHGKVDNYKSMGIVDPGMGHCITRIEMRIQNLGGYTPKYHVVGLTFDTTRGSRGPYWSGISGAVQQRAEAKAPEGSCLSFVDAWTNDNIMTGLAFTFEPLSEFA